MAVVFLAYANSDTRHLPLLQREQELVYNLFSPRFLKDDFTLIREQYATLENVNAHLSLIGNQLGIFVFSGHAGSNMLQLTDSIANSGGLPAQLTPSIKNRVLKLVVLNGCSTAGQVKALLQAGVPAVVATNASIGDAAAKEFAVRFFENLSAKGWSIQQAFTDALGAAQMGADAGQTVGTPDKPTRDLGFLEPLDPGVPLWELFCSSPEAVGINPLPRKPPQPSGDFVPNKKLVEYLFEKLAQAGSPAVLEVKKSSLALSFGRKREAIINNYPFVISVLLQQLLAPTVAVEERGYDNADGRRLKQIGRLYHNTMELMATIMVAQLWEERLRNDAFSITPAVRELLHQYFYLTASQREMYNYVPLIRTIREFFDTASHKVEYFVDELKDLKEISQIDRPFGVACNYLYELRVKSLREVIPEDDLRKVCIKAEGELCVFLEHLYFLHRYRLNSIYNIDALRLRHEKVALFRHKVFQALSDVSEEDRSFLLIPCCMNSMGMVLLKKSVQQVGDNGRTYTANDLDFLNLTPFFMDRSAYEMDAAADSSYVLPNPMVFSHRREDGSYVFREVAHPDKKENLLTISAQSAYRAVCVQLEAFREMILNESVNAELLQYV